MGIIWLRGTHIDGEVLDYGIPLDEPIYRLTQDAEKFETLEVLGVEHEMIFIEQVR